MVTIDSPARTDWLRRWDQLLSSTHIARTEAGVTELLQRLARPQRPTMLAFVNAHAMNFAVRDTRFHARLVAADCLLRDGSGMTILFKAIKRAPGLNLNGTDLIPRLIAHFAGARIALFGTTEPYVSKAAEVIHGLALAPGSDTVIENGFHDPEHYLQRALTHRPALILLGMGMPKQEGVAALLRERLEHPCVIVCGGAILDFLGGKVPRAPRVFRALGLEWLYRLGREPRRLFNRYVIGNPVFIARSLLFAARQRQRHPSISRATPREEARSTRF